MLQTLDLCRRIKALLKQHGIKQATAALAINKDRSTLANKLAGRTQLYYDEVVKISELLGAPNLVSGTSEWQPQLDPKLMVLAAAFAQLPAEIQREMWLRLWRDLTYYTKHTTHNPLGHDTTFPPQMPSEIIDQD